MRLPRVALLTLCASLTALAYYLILFTNWGNHYRGATYLRVVATEAVAVLAVFCCLEVLRTEKLIPLRALAGALGAPLVLVTLLMFWLGIRKFVAP